MTYSIAIDGPAGSGKSTVAALVASRLNFEYLNSGALYRTISLFLFQNKIDYKKQENITGDILSKIQISWTPKQIYLNDIDVTNAIRQPEISNIASEIAIFNNVRNFVNKLINEISNRHNIIIDGRDIGSVVLPKATLKIFLDASIEIRAQRIFMMNQQLNISKPLHEIEQDVALRDQRDYNRTIAPLIKCDDAILIDSSNMSADQIATKIEALIKERM